MCEDEDEPQTKKMASHTRSSSASSSSSSASETSAPSSPLLSSILFKSIKQYRDKCLKDEDEDEDKDDDDEGDDEGDEGYDLSSYNPYFVSEAASYLKQVHQIDGPFMMEYYNTLSSLIEVQWAYKKSYDDDNKRIDIIDFMKCSLHLRPIHNGHDVLSPLSPSSPPSPLFPGSSPCANMIIV
eukprot:TRINITY_DN4324_c0_g3_i1.p1 TRINITY_DN4324_c0_g3~~TRINITY_DN4324_c0_g3_i1.p1  ORF type:complete len:206 (+),score=63.41 TRINITY_DN4324_c0_g3_i1:72-620(+)